MRRSAVLLILLAMLAGGARLFTGVVYGRDSPVAYFVLKSGPDIRMERPEAEGSPLSREIVLDSEDSQLAYGWLYLGLMRATPGLVVVMLVAAGVLLELGARRHR